MGQRVEMRLVKGGHRYIITCESSEARTLLRQMVADPQSGIDRLDAVALLYAQGQASPGEVLFLICGETA